MASGSNIKSAEKTYNAFTGMVKWSAISVAILVIIVVALIS